jgi:hypothetical protein
MMQPTIENYALTTGWLLRITWIEFREDSGERDTRIRNMEALLATSRLVFSNGLHKLKALIEGMVQYGMIDETSLPDVISRVADNLPVSIAAEADDETLAWDMMMERDKYNAIYGRGQYAPSEPEPEEIEVSEPRIEDELYNDQGLENILGGLNG